MFLFFQLTIKVTDVNDNAPRFELPDYQAHNVDEDVAVGTSILQGKEEGITNSLKDRIKRLIHPGICDRS